MNADRTGVPWVWDASALHAAAAADRVDVLLDLAAGALDPPSRHYTTAAVADELRRNGVWEPCPSHLEVTHVDGLDELQALGRWLAVVSSGQHSRGEATVLAWAEVHQAIPILDDKAARQAAKRHGLPAHGSLWVVAQAVRAGKIPHRYANSLVNTLQTAGARFPFPADGFVSWAEAEGLLEEDPPGPAQ